MKIFPNRINQVARTNTTNLMWLMFKQFFKGSPERIRTWRGNRVNIYPRYNLRHAVIRLAFQLYGFFGYDKRWIQIMTFPIICNLMTYDEYEQWRVDVHKYFYGRKYYSEITGYFNGITSV